MYRRRPEQLHQRRPTPPQPLAPRVPAQLRLPEPQPPVWARMLLRPARPRVVHIAPPHQPLRRPLLPLQFPRLLEELQVAERRPSVHEPALVPRDLFVVEPWPALLEAPVERS